MAEDPDKYFEVYDALWKVGEGAVPFQVLTHIEVGKPKTNGKHDKKLISEVTFYFEDLVTGDTIVSKEKVVIGVKRIIWNPFAKKGPFMLNSIAANDDGLKMLERMRNA